MTSGAFFNRSIFTHIVFPAMPAHMQTEALLLAVEGGNSPDVIAASIDMPVSAVRAIMRARHAHSLACSDYEPSAEEEVAPISGQASLRKRVLKRMRLLMDSDGVTRTSTVDMAEALAVRTASAARSVRELAAEGLMVCVRPGGPHRMAQYRITEKGHALLAEIGR